MNYDDILKKAIKLAEQSQDNKKEIKDIFQSISFSIENFTDGKASLRIIEKVREDGAFSRIARYTAGENPVDTYNAICIYIIQQRTGIEIAEWKIGKEGYPCSLTYSNNKEVYCSNKAELEQALAELIGTTEVGEILLEIIGR